jgi:hypothetical protein
VKFPPKRSLILSAGKAFPQTEVDFPQTRVCLDLKSVPFRNDHGCLVRALGIAAVDGVDVRDLGGQLGRLPTPLLVKRGPRVPLPSVIAIPVRFAVACEQERRQYANGNSCRPRHRPRLRSHSDTRDDYDSLSVTATSRDV